MDRPGPALVNLRALPTFVPTPDWLAELDHINRRRNHQIDHHKAKLRSIECDLPRSFARDQGSYSVPALRPNHRRKKQPVVLAPLKTNRVHAARVTSAADNVFRPVVTHYKSPIVSMNIDVPVSTRKFLSVPLKKETRRLRARQRHAQIELARKEHLWQLQLYKHHLPKRRVDTLRRITNAKAWFKIICAAKFALKANALVV